jgi:hypothetical protein
MKRYLVISAILGLLALPVAVGAQPTVIPPEANWTPYPPARGTIDTTRLTELLVKKGVITAEGQAGLAQTPIGTRPGRRPLGRTTVRS